MCGAPSEDEDLLNRIRRRRIAAGEPVTGFDPDKSVLDGPLDDGSRSGGDLGGDGVSDEGDARKPVISRSDNYTIFIDDVRVNATIDQERRIRELDDTQLKNFKRIFGG